MYGVLPVDCGLPMTESGVMHDTGIPSAAVPRIPAAPAVGLGINTRPLPPLPFCPAGLKPVKRHNICQVSRLLMSM